jgi:hypothetical protein
MRGDHVLGTIHCGDYSCAAVPWSSRCKLQSIATEDSMHRRTGIYLDDSAMKAVRRGTKLPRAQ